MVLAKAEPTGNAVAELIKASGFEPVSVGGINHAIRIEAFGDLHPPVRPSSRRGS
jgi:predicted dinucleotide-binding enzyme